MCKVFLRKKVVIAVIYMVMCFAFTAGTISCIAVSPKVVSASHVIGDVTYASDTKDVNSNVTNRNVNNYKGSTRKSTVNK